MRRLVSFLILVLAFQGSAVAQVAPVDVDNDLQNLPSLVLLIAPEQPARVYAGGVAQSTAIEVSVIEYAAGEMWWCLDREGGLSGVTHLSLACEQPGAVLVGAPYAMLVPSNAQGVGRFDVANLRGGGHTATGEMRFLVPDRASCWGSFTGRIASPDLTGDLALDLADLTLFARDYSTYNPRSDFDGDGVVNLSDLFMFATYFMTGG
jgi:hypothetical protein